MKTPLIDAGASPNSSAHGRRRSLGSRLKKRSFLSLTGLLVLAACNNQSPEPDQSNAQIQIKAPIAQLRLANADLTARVNLNGKQSTFNGNDFPDGNWMVPMDITAGQTHSISVQWFTADHLLIEETGSFFADSANPVIRPDLDFLSSGSSRFDSDCDGISNMQEIINGGELGIANAGTVNACAPDTQSITLDLNEQVFPGISKNYETFADSGLTDRVTSFSQAIQIRRVNAERSSAYSAGIAAEPVDSIQTRVFLSLHYNLLVGKFVRFQIDHAVSAEASELADAACKPFNQGLGFSCDAPFDWQEDHWYELDIQEVGTASLQARLVDMSSGEALELGVVTTDTQLQWLRALLGVSYQEGISNADCIAGLLPITYNYTPGIANGQVVSVSDSVLPNDCLQGGGGWNTSVRRSQTGLVRSLTVGRLE